MSEDQEELDVLWGAPGDFEHEVDPPMAQIREAQSLAGALNWLATRTRGDIAFGVRRMSSMSTLAPQRALALGKKILRYLIATPDVGLRMVQAGCAGSASSTAGQPEEQPTQEEVDLEQAGMKLFSQKHVRATTGEDRQRWVDSLQHEVESIKALGVYDAVTMSDVRAVEAERGKRLEIIPAKIVWAEKPAEIGSTQARRKARVVCCGNFEKKKQEELFTSLMDATSLRLIVKTWSGCWVYMSMTYW